MLRVLYGHHFLKAARGLPAEQQKKLAFLLELFAENPFDPSLNNHALQGSLRNYRSIDITGDYRLMYEWTGDGRVRLIDIGTHSNLYGK